MKKFLLSLTCLAFVLVLNAQNLLPNGDFENWEKKSRVPKGWITTKKVSVFSKSSDAYSGKNSWQIKYVPEEKNKHVRFTFDGNITLTAGTYDLKFYAKGIASIRFINLTKAGEKIGSQASDVNFLGTPLLKKIQSQDWKEYKTAFAIPADGEYVFNLAINSTSEESPLLLDALTLTKK